MEASTIQTLLLSLTIAGLYASVASGLTLQFGVTRIINFAHGEIVMLGSYITFFAYSLWGIPPFLGMMISGISMAVLSYFVFVGFLSKVLKTDEHNQILATLGLSIVLMNLAAIWWSPNSRALHAPPLLPPLRLGEVTVPGNNLVVLLTGIVLYLGLIAFMNKTRYGIQLRIASEDPELAVYTGVNVDRMFCLSFVIGGFTAGIAGGLVALVLYVQPMVGLDLVIRAFAIVALAGFGNIPGAMIGAVVLAMAEGVTSTFVPHGASWGYGVAFMLILVVLLVRPTGFFGKEVR
jgi:branched-chain amino acid transport system permease protein